MPARDLETDEDLEDDIEPIDNEDGDDETAAIIRKALAASDEDDDNDVFSEPLKEREITTVSVEDGLDLVDKATSRRKGKDAEAAPAAEAKEEKTEEAPQPEGEEAKTDAAAPTAPADLDALLDGIDGDRRTALVGRITAADEVMGIFRGREAELQAHGATPKEAMTRLIQLNAFANAKPDEYLAWAATQFAPEQTAELLGKVADRLGMKLVTAAEPEADPFEDEEVKALREENRQLKAAQATRNEIGPDAPQNRAMDDLVRFRTEAGPDGKLKRPLFDRLQQEIAAKAQAHVKSTGAAVTLADLDKFYTEVEGELRASLGVPASPAAQATPVVPEVDTKKAAADAQRKQRAMDASKSIDGTGQGASRRPALDASASLEDTLRRFAGI